ncbi:MAG: cysteine--tRNA ligase [Firmicutes bacterium]|jgi:cysteinyl-tRNA synthetase|nr:cysteine--tRNA ligase [Bacillota bacterium]
MSLRVYNTLTRSKEEFVPRKQGRVDIYQCGVTPYDYTHIGHARQYVFWDTVRRYLKYRGWKVFCVQNVTDVDDKIIARAGAEGVKPEEISEEYHRDFVEVMDMLGVERPDVMPKVTQHIPEIIRLVEGLIEKGYAYQADGDVFFDVTSFPGYGKLSGRSIDDMMAGARIEINPKKRNTMDFALWKSAKPGEPSWDSPWGAGRPGWHIECSALALEYLGSGFDMHGGGDELIFPHHENEIAQSEAFTGKEPFARYFVHHAMLNIDDVKMSKSLGNFFSVRDVLKEYEPGVIRHFFASRHYRSPANYGVEELEAAGTAYRRLVSTLDAGRRALAEAEKAGAEKAEAKEEGEGGSFAFASLMADAEEAEGKFIQGMDDDFNTAVGIAALHDLARSINEFLHTRGGMGRCNREDLEGLHKAVETFETIGGILGLFQESGASGDSGLSESLVSLLIEVRNDLRQEKEWALADKIRDSLKDIGIVLEDTSIGTIWKRI